MKEVNTEDGREDVFYVQAGGVNLGHFHARVAQRMSVRAHLHSHAVFMFSRHVLHVHIIQHNNLF